MQYLHYAELPIGRVAITEKHGVITNLFFENDIYSHLSEFIGEYKFECSPLLGEADKQLHAYFNGKLHTFDLPINPQGSPFMLAVWNEISKIPYGETATYEEIATRIGNPKALRIIGHANNKNPLPIFLPCHRVIGKNGTLVGYRGGLAIKKILLDLEAKYK